MWDPGVALKVASEAALEAGTMLREELHRPGGPRGSGSHAPIDEEVERMIRTRLRQTFPTWSILGEEGGLEGPAGRQRWVIDPNDGTASFLRGMRGSAVSIGLLLDGEPVLGVVHAPTAPNDRGDLIAWAVGLPLTRNGAVIERGPLPSQLQGGQVVLVSQDADRNPAANLSCVSPARYRAMPSIAYRLALVAVGEADAATSLAGTSAWDLVAGHALLRGIGAAVVNEEGVELRYPGGHAGAARIFAGSGAVARTLASRDWGSVFQPATIDPFARRFPLVRLERGEHVADAGTLARAQGCLLGQIAGDSLGSLVEFQDALAIRRAYPGGVRDLADGGTWRTLAGQPTDDSELALMLARSLVARGFDLGAIRQAYVEWLRSEPFDVGIATRRGLSGDPDPHTQANGSVMRVSPLGIFGHAMAPHELAQLARAESAITHPHPVCQDASAVFTVAIAHAIRSGEGAASTYEAARRWALEARIDDDVLASLEAAAEEPPADFQHHMGWVRIALQNAFYRLLHAPSLEEGVIDTVMAGGDTDTNGTIAGALLGAVHSRDAIPERWTRAILSCRAIEPGLRQRPTPFWPVDALELAERLLLAGPQALSIG